MSKRIGGKVKNIDEHRLEISLNDVFLGQMPSPLLKCVFLFDGKYLFSQRFQVQYEQSNYSALCIVTA